MFAPMPAANLHGRRSGSNVPMGDNNLVLFFLGGGITFSSFLSLSVALFVRQRILRCNCEMQANWIYRSQNEENTKEKVNY